MATKTVSLDEEAYERLKSMKKNKGESFSDVIKEITKERSLLDIAGIWKDKELEKKVGKTREETEKEMDKVAREIK